MAIEYAVIAGGCFWCTEAVFKDVIGVESVESGYTGGARPNPTYEQVCSGATGHAEAIRIGFDPEKVTFGDLLDISFVTHDPTQLNRQGNDVGTQYRSVIFYHSELQKETAEFSMQKSEQSGKYAGKYVTQIVPFEKFWPAETYHQGYYEVNPNQPYCSAVVGPKVVKFKKHFGDLGLLK